MTHVALHERLASAIGKTTYRRLGEMTQTHPETVRRYMQGQAPSAEFLAGVCDSFAINGDWLLTGRGPMRNGDVRAHHLGTARPDELLSAIANTLTEVTDRVERLEMFVQTLDVKLRNTSGTVAPEVKPARHEDDEYDDKPAGRSRDPSADDHAEHDNAAGRVGRAVAKRSPPPAD